MKPEKAISYLKWGGIILVLVAFTAIGRKIWLTFFPPGSKSGAEIDAAEEKAADDALVSYLKRMKDRGIKVGSSYEAIKAAANNLETLMNGLGDGYNGQLQILKGMPDKPSAIGVKIAFGKRDYSVFGLMKEHIDLSGWWIKELNDKERGILESYVK